MRIAIVDDDIQMCEQLRTLLKMNFSEILQKYRIIEVAKSF